MRTSITLHPFKNQANAEIHWENHSPLFTGLVTIYIKSKGINQPENLIGN